MSDALPETPAPSRAPGPAAGVAGVAGFAIGGTLVAFLGYAAISSALMLLLPSTPRVAVALAQAAGLLLPALVLVGVARLSGVIGPAPPARRTGAALAAGLATWTFALAMGASLAWVSALALVVPEFLRASAARLAEVYGPILTVAGPWDVVTVLATVTIVPALCEEVLFRGFLQRVLRARLRAAAAIGLTAFLFGALHLDVVGLPARVILGVALGLAYDRTGSLRVPMLMHAAHNLFSMLVMPWSPEEALAVPPPAEALVALGTSVPVAAIAAWAWWRTVRQLPAPGASA